MTRRYYTACNQCETESKFSEPKSWFNVSIRCTQNGGKLGDVNEFADLCSEDCRNKWIANKLKDWNQLQ